MEVNLKNYDSINIPKNAAVTVTKMGHLMEVQYMEKTNSTSPIIKLDKDRYVVMTGGDKGEIKEFVHMDNRSDSYRSLRATFKKLRYLINNNFTGASNELHVTLTYADNVTDTKQLYKDFDRFMKRLKRKYDGIDYLNVVEPQGRGAWHCHLLIRFNDLDKIYIANNDKEHPLRDMWGQGWVTIHSLKNVDNIGAYLTAYLADIEVPSTEKDYKNLDEKTLRMMSNGCFSKNEIVEKEVEQEDGTKIKKKFVKGGRLHLYPVGMNLYRKSKGIEMPEREKMIYSEFKKNVVGSAKPHYASGFEMLKTTDNGTDEHFNSLMFEQYNLKRKKQ